MNHQKKTKGELHLACVVAALEKCGHKLRPCPDTDADFVVTPADGSPEFKLQVWRGFIMAEKNRKRENIHLAFCDGESVYCYPHNKVLDAVCQEEMYVNSRSWQQLGYYFVGPKRRNDGRRLAKGLARVLAPYRIGPCIPPKE